MNTPEELNTGFAEFRAQGERFGMVGTGPA
jgi:hypothetical protein